MQLMATVQANEERLTKLTLETSCLNQQIVAIIRELQACVPKLVEHDAEMQKKAEILKSLIEKWERRKDGN